MKKLNLNSLNIVRLTLKQRTGDVYSREVINIEQGFEAAGFTVTTKGAAYYKFNLKNLIPILIYQSICSLKGDL